MEISNHFNIWYYYQDGDLIKKKKPIIPGDYVHTNSYEGCYRVYDVKLTHFTIMKNRRPINLPWNQFRCKRGDGKSFEVKIKRLTRNIDVIKNNMDTLKKGFLDLTSKTIWIP
jgi:hypothetical protein